MTHTMLTDKTLTRFEAEYIAGNYTAEDVEKIEFAAYVANMNKCAHPEWTESDIFADFLRVLAIDGITPAKKPAKTAADCIAAARAGLEAQKDCSAWSKGVTLYAFDLLDELEEAADDGYIDADDLASYRLVYRAMLNGASDWSQYSWGGSSLICNSDIAERLCCPSELKKTRGGERRPNSREEWLDVQARALSQAAARVWRAIRDVQKEA